MVNIVGLLRRQMENSNLEDYENFNTEELRYLKEWDYFFYDAWSVFWYSESPERLWGHDYFEEEDPEGESLHCQYEFEAILLSEANKYEKFRAEIKAEMLKGEIPTTGDKEYPYGYSEHNGLKTAITMQSQLTMLNYY